MGSLVGIFFVQTLFVYSDGAGRETPPLSPEAARGQELWLQHNCQACHQIFGFGGFLGPDLTNAAQTLTQARVDLMLTQGSGLMPAFGLAGNERRALLQFLTEIDRTGVSQPRLAPRLPPEELLAALVQKAGPLSALEAEGLAVVTKEKCIACHLPNFDTPVRAPDLTRVLQRLSKGGVGAVLATGGPGQVMPRVTFTARQQDGVVAFLAWLASHREQAERVFEVTKPGGGSLWSIPWFEYE